MDIPRMNLLTAIMAHAGNLDPCPALLDGRRQDCLDGPFAAALRADLDLHRLQIDLDLEGGGVGVVRGSEGEMFKDFRRVFK